jgi:hypothetical protein
MAWIYFTKSFPLTGDGWRRVHSIVSPDGKLTLPIIGYMKVDEFPIHAGRKETIKDGIFVYDEVFAKTFNPDWAIRADKSAKTYETVGAIIADAGLILLICGSHNGGHHGGNNGQGSVPGGVDGSVPPDLPPGF